MSKNNNPRIGIVAPSSKVPAIEFKIGLERVREAGFEVEVHPQVRREFRFWAGNDEERAKAFFDYACDPRFHVIWCARGGYGAARLLPYLDRMVAKEGIPEPKLLLGYSDATILLEYVRTRWGWTTMHSPMPGMRKFCVQTPLEWKSLTSWIRGEAVSAAVWGKRPLKWVGGNSPAKALNGEMIGGNLTVWVSLLGTSYAPSAKGKILFFEDVDESVYRIDRMVQQLAQAGGLDGVRAVVLGNFQSCNDHVGKVLSVMPTSENRERLLTQPSPEELKPLRKKMDGMRAVLEIFHDACHPRRIPVAYGLPVGHGPGVAPLPLGADYRLSREGRIELVEWDWLNS